MGLGRWVLNREEPVNGLIKCRLGRVTSGQEGVGHLIRVHAHGLEGSRSGAPNLSREDGEFLDGITGLVNANHALLGCRREKAESLLTVESEGLEESPIFVRGIEEIPLHPGSRLLRSGRHDVERMGEVGGETFAHQLPGGLGNLRHVLVKGGRVVECRRAHLRQLGVGDLSQVLGAGDDPGEGGVDLLDAPAIGIRIEVSGNSPDSRRLVLR